MTEPRDLEAGAEMDARAERAILSAAEAYRLVTENVEQRQRADRAERERDQLKAQLAALAALLGTEDLGEAVGRVRGLVTDSEKIVSTLEGFK